MKFSKRIGHGHCLLWACALWLTSGGPAVAEPPVNLLEIADAQVTLAHELVVSAAIGGTLAELLVREGDRVEPDQLIARLDPRQAQAEVDACQEALRGLLLESRNDVDVRFATMTLQVHRKELEAALAANRQAAGSLSESEIRRRALVVRQAELQIEQAQHLLQVKTAKAAEQQAALTAAKLRLNQHDQVTARAGVVVQVFAKPGQWIAQGSPVVRLVDLDRLRVECFVDEQQAEELAVGAAVWFQPAGDPEARFAGNVVFISPEFHPVSGQTRLWAEIDNDGRLRPGMRGTLGLGSVAEAVVQF